MNKGFVYTSERECTSGTKSTKELSKRKETNVQECANNAKIYSKQNKVN